MSALYCIVCNLWLSIEFPKLKSAIGVLTEQHVFQNLYVGFLSTHFSVGIENI